MNKDKNDMDAARKDLGSSGFSLIGKGQKALSLKPITIPVLTS